MRKKTCIIIIAAVLSCLLFGCVKQDDTAPSESVSKETAYVPIDASAVQLTVSEESASFSGINTVYPSVSGTPAKNIINDKIQKAVAELATDNYTDINSVDYEVCYNSRGIFSMLLKAHLKEGTSIRCSALNLNSVSGEDIKLSDIFDDSGVGEEIASLYIDTVIRLKKLDTYAKVTLSENKEFYLTESALVILCETYEFTYYNTGDTQFFIPYSLLSSHCAQGSAVEIIAK